MTQAELARELGISPGTIDFWRKHALIAPIEERGRGLPLEFSDTMLARAAGIKFLTDRGRTLAEVKSVIGGLGGEMGEQYVIKAEVHGLKTNASAEQIVNKVNSYPGEIRCLRERNDELMARNDELRAVAFGRVTKIHEAGVTDRSMSKVSSAAPARFASDEVEALAVEKMDRDRSGKLSKIDVIFKVLAENPALAERRRLEMLAGTKESIALAKHARGATPKTPLPEARVFEDLRQAIRAIQLEQAGITFGDAMSLALSRNPHLATEYRAAVVQGAS
jgi:DNA-binding transcriptional MerR regulator